MLFTLEYLVFIIYFLRVLKKIIGSSLWSIVFPQIKYEIKPFFFHRKNQYMKNGKYLIY